MLPFTYVPFGGALQWPAECEWQAAESQTQCCEYCVKGQTHDDKSVCDGWASLLKVGPSLPSSTTTALCQPCAMQTPVSTSFNSNPVTGQRKEENLLIYEKRNKKQALLQRIATERLNSTSWQISQYLRRITKKYIYFFYSKQNQYLFSWFSTTNLLVLMGF